MTSDPVVRLGVLLGALVVAVAVGLWARWRSGRARVVSDGAVLTPADVGAPLGDRGTLVQFSTSVCAPCRSTRRVLGDLAAGLPGVSHVEVDAEDRLDLAKRLHVVRTPTVLLLDADGRVRGRASGGLTPAQARALVAPLVAPLVAR